MGWVRAVAAGSLLALVVYTPTGQRHVPAGAVTAVPAALSVAVLPSPTTVPGGSRPVTAPVAASAVPAPSPSAAAQRGSPSTSPATKPQPLAVTAPGVASAPQKPPSHAAAGAVGAAVGVGTQAPALLGVEALARISYPWAALGYQVAFHGPRDGFFGLTDCINRRIDIYVTHDQDVAQVAFVVAFEIAHAVDCTRLSSDRQARWAELRGFQLRGPWFPPCSCAEDSYPSGDFAEVFARWQAGPVYGWRSRLAPAPTGAQFGALVPFLES